MGKVEESAGGISDVVKDTTPQLGGNLDVNGKKIVSVSNGNIDIEPNGTGDVLLGNFTFDADQTVGAGQDNYVLTYDNAGGKISLEAAAGGGGDFADGGDAGGAARSLGNTDNYDLHFLTNNADRLHITSDGKISTGAETAPDCSAGGMCLVPADATGLHFSIKDVGVGHGLTKYAETDTYFSISEITDNAGGTTISSFTDGDETFSIGMSVRTFLRDTADTTTSAAGLGMFSFYAWQHDGANTESAPAATANIVAFRAGGSSAVLFKGNGNVEADGTVTSNSYDFAEYFESTDGTAIDNGTPVVLDNGKVREASEGEVPFGVISATAGFIGNQGLDWQGKYLRDNFGKLLMDEDGYYILNPEYDPDFEFIPRNERPEWNVVGLVGQVYIKKGAPVNPNWALIKDANAEADLYLIK